MTFLLDIINGINKFLGYLDISPKYLNRAYTVLSIIPTVYILRILYGLFINQNYLQFLLYSLAFLVLLYFFILNVFYYFFDKNIKGDVTQLFVKYLPDEVFNIQTDTKRANMATIDQMAVTVVPVEFQGDYPIVLARQVQTLIEKKVLTVNDLTQNEGFAIAENTLYPYYYVKPVDDTHYHLQIGTDYTDLVTIGQIVWPITAGPLQPVGLFLAGGEFNKAGVRYQEPYQLKLYAKKKEQPLTNEQSMAQRATRSRR